MQKLLSNHPAFARILIVAASILGLSASLLAGPASASSADGTQPPVTTMGQCGDVFNPDIGGARAHWSLKCEDGLIHVDGWVEDTDGNARCAKVKAYFASGTTEFSRAACPEGDREYFHWHHPGQIADVYLYEYDV